MLPSKKNPLIAIINKITNGAVAEYVAINPDNFTPWQVQSQIMKYESIYPIPINGL